MNAQYRVAMGVIGQSGIRQVIVNRVEAGGMAFGIVVCTIIAQ